MADGRTASARPARPARWSGRRRRSPGRRTPRPRPLDQRPVAASSGTSVAPGSRPRRRPGRARSPGTPRRSSARKSGVVRAADDGDLARPVHQRLRDRQPQPAKRGYWRGQLARTTDSARSAASRCRLEPVYAAYDSSAPAAAAVPDGVALSVGSCGRREQRLGVVGRVVEAAAVVGDGSAPARRRAARRHACSQRASPVVAYSASSPRRHRPWSSSTPAWRAGASVLRHPAQPRRPPRLSDLRARDASSSPRPRRRPAGAARRAAPGLGQRGDRQPVPGRDHLVVAARLRALSRAPRAARRGPAPSAAAASSSGSCSSCSVEAPCSNVPVRRHLEQLRRPRAVVRTEHLDQLRRRPDVRQALDAVGVRVERGREAALSRAQVAQQELRRSPRATRVGQRRPVGPPPVQRTRAAAKRCRTTSSRSAAPPSRRRRCSARSRRRAGRTSRRGPSPRTCRSAISQRPRGDPGPRVVAQQELQDHRRRELRRAAEPAARGSNSSEPARARPRRGRRRRRRAPARRASRDAPRPARVGDRRGRRRRPRRAGVAPGLGDRGQQLRERRHARARCGREVRARVERLAVRREEARSSASRPGRSSPGRPPCRRRRRPGRSSRSTLTLTKPRVHQRGGRLVLERLVRHDVAPVAGGVPDARAAPGRRARAASANASSPHSHQSTGLSLCCNRYGLVEAANRLKPKHFQVDLPGRPSVILLLDDEPRMTTPTAVKPRQGLPEGSGDARAVRHDHRCTLSRRPSFLRPAQLRRSPRTRFGSEVPGRSSWCSARPRLRRRRAQGPPSHKATHSPAAGKLTCGQDRHKLFSGYSRIVEK